MSNTALRYSTDTLTGLARALDTPGGGFTFDAFAGLHVSDGYAVAVVDNAEQQITGPVSRADVVEYALKYAATLAQPGMRLGGWRDAETGIAYLDISCVVATRKEAHALAAQHNQVAFYSLTSGQTIYV